MMRYLWVSFFFLAPIWAHAVGIGSNEWSSLRAAPQQQEQEQHDDFASLTRTLLDKFSHEWMTNLNVLSGEPISLRRSLNLGDFDEFNALFSGAVIRLPDAQVSKRILFTDLNINIRNLLCTNMQVGDILIDYNMESSFQKLTIKVDIVDIDMNCNMDFTYDYGFIDGPGKAKAKSNDNDATVTLAFASSNFNTSPPTSINVDNCETNIKVNSLDFDGGFVVDVLDLDIFEGLISGVVEREVGGVACSELGSLGTTFVGDVLDLAAETINPYLGVLAAPNPLAPELAMNVPKGVKLLNLQDSNSTITKWFDAALQEADALLGTEVEDTQRGGTDLGINVFLRKNLLDSKGAFVLDVATVFPDGLTVFDGHDKLTETTIELNSVKIYGLDTFTKFEPLLDIGKYTLQNELAWEFLAIELDVTITIKPSTLEDSVIEQPTVSEVVENVKINFGVDNLDTVVSLLLAVDENELAALQLGPLLNTANLLPCLLSTLFQVELTELAVQIGSVRLPTLEDFVSPGIDRVVSRTVEAVWLMYDAVLQEAMPNMFGTKVMDIVNTDFIQKFITEPKNVKCVVPEITSPSPYIDFRDLFLKPEAALAAGATGEAPYGNVAYTLMTLLQEQFLAPGDDGLPKVNSILRTLSESQSGSPGEFYFPSSLFHIVKDVEDEVWSSFTNRFELKMFDTKIQNVDILTSPLSIVQPNMEPHLLTNLINIGPVADRPLNASLRLLMSLEGEDSPLSMRNDFDIRVSVPFSVLVADILATVDTDSLLEFPLGDVLNYNCWLATIPAPELDENGNWLEPGADPSLTLQKFFLTLSSLRVGVDCVTCTSTGVAILPELLGTLETTGVAGVLRDRMESFASELVQGDWLQLVVDRFLSNAPQQCPHHRLYQEDFVATDYGLLGFPNLSRDSLETLILGGATAAQVALFVFAESHVLMPAPEPTDPLSGQAALEVPPGTRLIDFTDLGGSVGEWAETLLEEAKKIISGSVNTNSTSGSSSFDVAQLLRDLLLNDEGALSIKFEDLGFEEAGVRVELAEIRIAGLDSITKLDVLDAIAPQTLQNSLSLGRVTVDVVVAIGLAGQPTEEMTVSFGVSNVDVSLAIMIALDLDRLGDIELGSIMNTKQILPCFLSTLRDVDISQFLVNVGTIDDPTVDGFLSDAVRETLVSSMQTIFDGHRATLLAAIPNISSVTVAGLMNGVLKAFVSKEEASICPSMASKNSSFGFVDFRDLLLPPKSSRELGGSGDNDYGDLFRTVLDLVKEQVLTIDPATGLSSINNLLIKPLTKGQSNEIGTILLPGNLLDVDSDLSVGGLEAKIELKAYNARIQKLDTVGEPTELLQPMMNEPYRLNNTASLGVGQDPVRFAVTLLIALTGDGNMQLRNEVDISVDLNFATVLIGALLKISEEPLFSFPLRDMTNLYCWLATIPAPPLDARGVRAAGFDSTAALTHLAVSVARMGLNITCISCSSPDMDDLAALLSSPEAVDDATEVANMVLEYVTKLLGGEFLQIQIDRFLNDAAQRCPNNDAYQENPTQAVYEPFESSDREDNSITFLIAMVVAAACLFAAVVIIVLFVRWIVRRRHRAWLRTLTNDNITSLHREQMKEVEISQATRSMFTSPSIPCYVRYFIPIVILGNIALFLSGHLSLGASVNIEASLAGERFTVEKFFDFSMAQSTVDIYNAGGKELAILILIFSGVWPYTKQLITLALWFLPPRVVSVTRRGTIFYWLDALAKWSMVDIFALVISIASFRVSIESPEVAFLTQNFYSIDLMVVPMWGLYANMLAQLVSQVSSHFIIHYHRRIISVAKKEDELTRQLRNSDTIVTADNESFRSGSEIESGSSSEITDGRDGIRDQLCQHAFVRPHRSASDKLQVRRGVNAVIVMVAVAIIFLVIFGCSRPSFSIEVLGVIGVAVESGQGFESAVTDYSVFGIVSLLMEEARFLDTAGDYIGLGTLSILVILTVLVVPLAQTLALLRHWFTPMTREHRAKIATAVEILQAWQYVEVYIIAVIVSAWQLGPVSDFMINEYCSDLESTFATLVYYGILDRRDAQCFMVQASVEKATYMLISAAILLALINAYVMEAVAQYNRDTDPSLNRLESNPKLEEAVSENGDEDIFAVMEKIHPVPVMFSDTFRWTLRREDAIVSRSMTMGLDDDAKLGVEEGFPGGASDAGSKAEIDGAVPIMLSLSGSEIESNTESFGDENFAVNEPLDSVLKSPEEPVAFVDDGTSESSADETPPSSNRRPFASIRSLFSSVSSASSRVEESEWKCEACSYSNADVRNRNCALCGQNREAPFNNEEGVVSSSNIYLTPSVPEGDATAPSGLALEPIQENTNSEHSRTVSDYSES